MRRVLAGFLILMMSWSAPALATAQSGAQDDAKKAGAAAKAAGKNTGTAAKEAGKATAKTAKKGAKTVKKAVTGDAHATCVDGTRQAGETEARAAAACASHGGVAKQ